MNPLLLQLGRHTLLGALPVLTVVGLYALHLHAGVYAFALATFLPTLALFRWAAHRERACSGRAFWRSYIEQARKANHAQGRLQSPSAPSAESQPTSDTVTKPYARVEQTLAGKRRAA